MMTRLITSFSPLPSCLRLGSGVRSRHYGDRRSTSDKKTGILPRRLCLARSPPRCAGGLPIIGNILSHSSPATTARYSYLAADPLATVFICVVISFTSYRLVRDAIHILLEGTPAHIDMDDLREALLSVEGVTAVHDIHLWSLCSGNDSRDTFKLLATRVDTNGAAWPDKTRTRDRVRLGVLESADRRPAPDAYRPKGPHLVVDRAWRR